MGTGDVEDPMELEALREEAEEERSGASVERFNFLANRDESMTEGLEYRLVQYLSIFDRQLIDEIASNPVEHDMLTALSTINKGGAIVEEEGHRQDREELRQIRGPRDDPRFSALSRSAVMAKDILSELRSFAVLASQNGKSEEYIAACRKDFADIVIRQHAILGLPLPDHLKFLGEQAIRRKLQDAMPEVRTFGDQAVAEDLRLQGERLADNLKTKGTSPQFIAPYVREAVSESMREAQAQDEQAIAERKWKLVDFNASYPDPRLIVDKILALKDGKLPV